jgi:SAM-dependent methyltransferase
MFLKQTFDKYNTRKLLDVGCGVWEHLMSVNLSGIEYLGIDVVDSVIRRNEELDLPANVRFQCGTLEDVESLETFDTVVIKDVFQHLPDKLIFSMLTQLKNIPVLVVTNDYTSDVHSDCDLGGFRKLDLEAPPFSLQASERLDFESDPFSKRTLVVLNGASADVPGSNTLSCFPTV